MTVLVLGSNGSGKSMYAEKLATRFSTGALYYVATMVPYGDEGQARVEKHKKQRGSMGFITVEKPFYVSEIPFRPDSVVLLEDVSNLVGNALFDGNRDGSEAGRGANDAPLLAPATWNSVFADIAAMCAKCRDVVLVSIDGLSVQPEYDEETCGYIYTLNRLNTRLADFSDTVVKMCGGAPVFVKGEAYALD